MAQRFLSLPALPLFADNTLENKQMTLEFASEKSPWQTRATPRVFCNYNKDLRYRPEFCSANVCLHMAAWDFYIAVRLALDDVLAANDMYFN